MIYNAAAAANSARAIDRKKGKMALPAMPALLLALLLLPGCSGHQPHPPSISTYQHHLLETVAAAAEPAAAAAMPELLAALDADSFRTALAECCPHIAQLAAPALLAELEAEFAVTEQVHNIRLPDGGGGPGGGDVTLALAKTLSWFPNLWELPFLSGHGGCDSMQDNAEVELFGFRPFAEGGNFRRSVGRGDAAPDLHRVQPDAALSRQSDLRPDLIRLLASGRAQHDLRRAGRHRDLGDELQPHRRRRAVAPSRLADKLLRLERRGEREHRRVRPRAAGDDAAPHARLAAEHAVLEFD